MQVKSFALDNPITGFGGALLNLIHVSQDCTRFSMIAFRSLSNKPALLISFLMFSVDAWPNCLCILITWVFFFIV